MDFRFGILDWPIRARARDRSRNRSFCRASGRWRCRLTSHPSLPRLRQTWPPGVRIMDRNPPPFSFTCTGTFTGAGIRRITETRGQSFKTGPRDAPTTRKRPKNRSNKTVTVGPSSVQPADVFDLKLTAISLPVFDSVLLSCQIHERCEDFHAPCLPVEKRDLNPHRAPALSSVV